MRIYTDTAAATRATLSLPTVPGPCVVDPHLSLASTSARGDIVVSIRRSSSGGGLSAGLREGGQAGIGGGREGHGRCERRRWGFRVSG